MPTPRPPRASRGAEPLTLPRRERAPALAMLLAAAVLTACGGSPASLTSEAGVPDEARAAAPAAVVPATLAQAHAALDLTTLSLPEGAEVSADATAVALGYRSPAPLESAFDAQRRQLEALGWTPVGDPQVHPPSASGVFGKSGFTLSLMVMTDGSGSAVQLRHHGNVDLATFARPEGVEVRFAQALSAVWETDAALDEASARLREALIYAGWEPYGEAGPMRYYRANALRLGVMSAASPTPGGKTLHHLGIEMLSAQIPMPPASVNAGFDLGTQTLRFSHAGAIEELIRDYGPVLAAQGWRQSLDAPIASDGEQVMTWRNPTDDLLTLALGPSGSARANGSVAYRTRAQIAEMNRRLDEQAAAHRASKRSG